MRGSLFKLVVLRVVGSVGEVKNDFQKSRQTGGRGLRLPEKNGPRFLVLPRPAPYQALGSCPAGPGPLKTLLVTTTHVIRRKERVAQGDLGGRKKG